MTEETDIPDTDAVPPAASQPSKNKFKEWGEKLAWLVVGGAVVFAYSLISDYRDGTIRELVYAVQSTPNFVTKEKAKIDMTRNGLPIDAVSAARLLVFNNTDKNFTDLNLIVKLTSERPIDLIAADVDAGGKLYDFETITENDNEIVRSYVLPVVNKKNASFFTVDYRFVGSKPPKIEAVLQQEGAELKRIDADSLLENDGGIDDGYLVIFLTFCIIVMIILNAIGNRYQKKTVDKLRKENIELQKMIDTHFKMMRGIQENYRVKDPISELKASQGLAGISDGNEPDTNATS